MKTKIRHWKIGLATKEYKKGGGGGKVYPLVAC